LGSASRVNRPGTEGDQVGEEVAQEGRTQQEAEEDGQPERLARTERAGDHPPLRQALRPLHQARRPLAPALHGRQVPRPQPPGLERAAQHVGRDDGVLDGQVDAYPADRRRHVGRVAYQEQPGAVPALKAIGLHREQRALPPILEVPHAVGELRRQFGD
jgi:hypothetical protein